MRKTLLIFICTFLLLTGCQTAPASEGPQTSQIFAMDTVMDLSVYTDDDTVLDEAAQLVTDLEQTLSTTVPDSDIHMLNETGSAELSDAAGELLGQALAFCRETDGVLDLSIYPVVRAWGFTTETYQVPAEAELAALLDHVDYTQIQYDAETGTVSLPAGMEIDLGSVAKGYTGDRLLALFRDHGASYALLNLGGNVQALGAKPDGSPWRIGIQDPLGDSHLGVLEITDEAVITSGGYERYFTDEAGNVYWHIIDPATGYPAKNGLISATAVGPRGVYCDALSTSLFIMGPEQALRFWQAHRDFEMILVTEDQQVLITPALADRFHLVEGTPYRLKVVEDA